MGMNQQSVDKMLNLPENIEQDVHLGDPSLTRLANTRSIGELLLVASEIQAAQIDLIGSDKQPTVIQ
jgi:hypothetical protein